MADRKRGTANGRRHGERTLEMPPPIPDTPEAVAKAVLNTPPKKNRDWRYLKNRA